MEETQPNSSLHELTIVMLCFNEEKAPPRVLPEIIKFCETNHWKLIIVNDGSRDQTAAILANHTHHPLVRIIHHKVNRGYGAALTTGISQCTTPHLITIDADGQHRLEDIPAMLEAHKQQNADLTIGRRIYPEGEDSTRRAGKLIIRTIAKFLFPHMHIRDLNSGIKLYNTPIAKAFSPFCPESMAFSDVMSLMHFNLGLKVIEHPVKINKRLAGKSTIGLNTAIDTLIEILNLLILFKPLRLFLPLSTFFVLLGGAWGLRFLLLGRGLSTIALLLLSAGIILLATGLLAEQNAILIKANLRERLGTISPLPDENDDQEKSAKS